MSVSYSHGVAVPRSAVAGFRFAAVVALMTTAFADGPARAATGSAETTPHESYIYTSCDVSPCRRQMYTVPDNLQLRVFALSCAARTSSPGTVAHIGVRRTLAGGGEEVVDLAANLVGVQGNTQYFAFEAGADSIVLAGDTVDAFVDSTSPIDAFYCFLAGDLTDALHRAETR